MSENLKNTKNVNVNPVDLSNKQGLNYQEIEKELNAKIIEITEKINFQYPELTKYLSEIAITIPDESDPEVTVSKLQDYCNSLCAIVNKYEEEHP